MAQEKECCKLIFTHVTFANPSHSQKTRRLNTREHSWIYGILTTVTQLDKSMQF